MGFVFAAMTWVSQVTFRRARLDGDNDSYFDKLEPATLRDFWPPALAVAGLTVTGIYLWASAHLGWFACVALLGAAAVLAAQVRTTDRFWRLSMEV